MWSRPGRAGSIARGRGATRPAKRGPRLVRPHGRHPTRHRRRMPIRRSEVAAQSNRPPMSPTGPDDSSSSALPRSPTRSRSNGQNLPALIPENVRLFFSPFRYILGHEEVPYGDASIEVAEIGGARKFSQFVVPDRFLPVMIRLARWVLHNPCSKRILLCIVHGFGRANVSIIGLSPGFRRMFGVFPALPCGVLRRDMAARRGCRAAGERRRATCCRLPAVLPIAAIASRWRAPRGRPWPEPLPAGSRRCRHFVRHAGPADSGTGDRDQPRPGGCICTGSASERRSPLHRPRKRRRRNWIRLDA
jgi:hypothetical protein